MRCCEECETMLEKFIVVQVGTIVFFFIICVFISGKDVLRQLKEAPKELKLALAGFLSMTWVTVWVGAILLVAIKKYFL